MRNIQSTNKQAKSCKSGNKNSSGIAGRVVLAAIVHHEKSADLLDVYSTSSKSKKVDETTNFYNYSSSLTSTSSSSLSAAVTSKEQVAKEKRKSFKSKTSNTHVDKSLRKIGEKLFFKRTRKEEEDEDEERKVSTAQATLIDNTDGLKLSKKNSNKIRLEGEDGDDDVDDDDEKCCEFKNTEQVIEFKFDLIVEKKNQDKDDADLLTTKTGEGEESSSSFKGEEEEEEEKLNDNVNELVESFVLDSNDACLMSIQGGRKTTLNIGYHLSQSKNKHKNRNRNRNKNEDKDKDKNKDKSKLSTGNNQFDYVSELASHTLAYSFHLLNSKIVTREEDKQLEKSDPHHLDKLVDNSRAGNNYYSIELSATLFSTINEMKSASEHFSRDHHDERPFSIVDLMLDDDDDNEISFMREYEARKRCDRVSQLDDDTPNFAQELTSVDCVNLKQALNCIGRIRRKLRSILDDETREMKQLLLICFKLKQRINGGLFTNRLTIIDYNPKFFEFQTIFESIFNGQALSYLKRKRSYDYDDDDNQTSYFNTSLRTNKSNSLRINDDSLWREKQNHQVASKCEKQRLLQAEWILYKQLSSAMIGTLIVVHVHKLSASQVFQHQPPTNLNVQTDKKDKQVNSESLMDNLLLLEFARSIKRASTLRLKRRKRHLESDLALQSNVSVSTSNLSGTSITNELLRSLRQSAAQNQALLHNTGSLNARKSSLDMSSALARRHHKHKHHHHHHHSYTGRSSAATSSSNKYKKSSPIELTESSSISTSSGSQTCRHIRGRRCRNSASRSDAIDRHFQLQLLSASNNNNNLSDNSDSIKSGAIIGRRSSSLNHNHDIHLKSHAMLTSNSRQLLVKRKDVDSKWLMRKQELNDKWPDNLELDLLDDDDDDAGEDNNCRSSRAELDASNCSTPTKRKNKTIHRVIPLLNATSSSTIIPIDCKKSETTELEENDVGRKIGSNSRNDFIYTFHDNSKTGLMMMNACGDIGSANEDYFCRKNEDKREEDEAINSSSFLNCSAFEDQASEILSVIAEPPKQLRLEKFLNQLNSIISPMKQITAQSDTRLNGFTTDDSSYLAFMTSIENSKAQLGNDLVQASTASSHSNLQAELTIPTDTHHQLQIDFSTSSTEANDSSNLLMLPMDEDDEDCKSHSSILEHLSSLALESNSKLNHISKQRQKFHGKKPYYSNGEG